MTDTPERDPLEELLAPPRPADAEALRQSILAATTRRLRRRRWLRRGALAAALAACFAAGMLTMRLLAPAAPAADGIAQSDGRPEQEAPSAPGNEAPAPPPRDRDVAAVLLQAGDRYLNEEGDPEAALRCYTKALNAVSDGDARFSPDDNWLLMAIKTAREKEARHANDDG
jgi:hypothetical protein